METPSLTAAVRRELLAHPDVTEGAHRFGGIVFHLGRCELGHLHGERVADLPFPPHIVDELVASGRVSADHVVSDSAWVSRTVNGPEDVAEIVALFRRSYEHAASQVVQDSHREEHQDAAPDADRQRKATWRVLLALPARRTLRRQSRR
jgi:predicted DNA-binding protein (MmcQ/YjbR family)